MTTHELLADLRKQGFRLTPLPGDRLEVRPFSKLPETLRQELKRRKTEILALLTRPYLNDLGELIIPLTCDPRYRWWSGGQSIAQTLIELNASPEILRRYLGAYTETRQ